MEIAISFFSLPHRKVVPRTDYGGISQLVVTDIPHYGVVF
jgi:hypothetical protein